MPSHIATPRGGAMARPVVPVVFALVVAAVALAGCAAKTATTADAMRGYSADAQELVDLKNRLAGDWDRGQKLILSGEKNIEAGQRRIEAAERELQRGREQVEHGNREVAEGGVIVREAEHRFREAFPLLDLGPGQ